MNEQCTRKGCFAQRTQGDMLFCQDDRLQWRRLMMKFGIAENPYVPQEELELYMAQFQHNDV